MDCIARHAGFSQVCVWPGTTVGADRVKEFEEYMLAEFGVRVQYLEEILIKPGQNYTPSHVDDNDARCSLFFAVHKEDIEIFAVPRLLAGIRWVEDVLSRVNNGWYSYPERVFDYRSWYC
jgi:hypothetical protein